MARYDSLRKPLLKWAVETIHKEHPEISQEEIGFNFNIKKQRVNQILHPKTDKDILIERRVIPNGG